jgi:hypothetical protein
LQKRQAKDAVVAKRETGRVRIATSSLHFLLFCIISSCVRAARMMRRELRTLEGRSGTRLPAQLPTDTPELATVRRPPRRFVAAAL